MRMSIVEVQNQENIDWENRLLWILKRANRRSDRARCIQFTLSNSTSISFILMLSVSTFMSFKWSRPSTCPDSKSCKQFWAFVCVPSATLVYLPFVILKTSDAGPRWLRGLKSMSGVAWLLGSRVWILPRAFVFFCCVCCVFAGSCLCDGLITPSGNATTCECLILCDLETLRGGLGPNWAIAPQRGTIFDKLRELRSSLFSNFLFPLSFPQVQIFPRITCQIWFLYDSSYIFSVVNGQY